MIAHNSNKEIVGNFQRETIDSLSLNNNSTLSVYYTFILIAVML